jgi:hypothetical protein
MIPSHGIDAWLWGIQSENPAPAAVALTLNEAFWHTDLRSKPE